MKLQYFLKNHPFILHRKESSEFKKLVKDALNHEEIEDYACMYTQPPCPYQGRKLLEKVVITTPQIDPKPAPQTGPQPAPQPKPSTEDRVVKEMRRVPKNVKKTVSFSRRVFFGFGLFYATMLRCQDALIFNFH